MVLMITDKQVGYMQKLQSQTNTDDLPKPIRELTQSEANWHIKRLKAILGSAKSIPPSRWRTCSTRWPANRPC